jgi:antitoxin protein of toxin-antitoxin system
VPDFGEMADKAKDAADDHEEQVDGGLDKAGDAAGEKFGHEEQIDKGVDKLQERTGDGK